MKKILILLTIIVFLTGCNDKRNTIIDNNSQSSFFEISSNYKKGKSGFYIIDSYNHRIDTKDVELGLMNVSANYFNINNTYYQNGQYLDRKELKKMITEINKNPIKINNVEYKLPLVNYIYETNYLNGNNKLKGLSLVVALNSTYLVNSTELKPSNKELMTWFKENNNVIFKTLREDKDLEKTKVVTSLYKLNVSNNELPGSYIARGVTTKDKVSDLVNINEKHVIMNSTDFKNIDELNYKAYFTLETELRAKYKSLLINGVATYQDNNLVDMDIIVNVGAVSITNVMAIGQDMINEINQSFANKNIKVIIKNDNRDAAFIIFNNFNKNGNIYLLP